MSDCATARKAGISRHDDPINPAPPTPWKPFRHRGSGLRDEGGYVRAIRLRRAGRPRPDHRILTIEYGTGVVHIAARLATRHRVVLAAGLTVLLTALVYWVWQTVWKRRGRRTGPGLIRSWRSSQVAGRLSTAWGWTPECWVGISRQDYAAASSQIAIEYMPSTTPGWATTLNSCHPEPTCLREASEMDPKSGLILLAFLFSSESRLSYVTRAMKQLGSVQCGIHPPLLLPASPQALPPGQFAMLATSRHVG